MPQNNHPISLVLLAAGYGTRLERDLIAQSESSFLSNNKNNNKNNNNEFNLKNNNNTTIDYSSLIGLPKSLLPVIPGTQHTLLDEWIEQIKQFNENQLQLQTSTYIRTVHIVTNTRHYPYFVRWMSRVSPLLKDKIHINLLHNGTASNETRQGAIADLSLVLESQIPTNAKNDALLIMASDLLFDFGEDSSSQLNNVIHHFHDLVHSEPNNSSNSQNIDQESTFNRLIAQILCYQVKNNEERSKRGIVAVDDQGWVTRFVEKPQDYSQIESDLAVPAFYIFSNLNETKSLVSQFLTKTNEEPVEARDAPGKLFRWLCNLESPLRPSIAAKRIQKRFDIGNLNDYQKTLDQFTSILSETNKASPSFQNTIDRHQTKTSITEKAYARVGLIGNPSDGFKGHVISFTISNFWAQVTLRAASYVSVVAHPIHDGNQSYTLADLCAAPIEGGVRILKAVCRVFFRYVTENRIRHPSELTQGFEMCYDTNIPRQVGLSGSSAIATAGFNALMKWFDIGEEEIPKTIRANLIMNAEKKELGIACGLQDRVAQVYTGLVDMDFANIEENNGCGEYQILPCDLLPELFIAFIQEPGQCSGRVHSDITQRYRDGDEQVHQTMFRFAENARRFKQLLLNSCDSSLNSQSEGCTPKERISQMMDLMNTNFDLRRKLYGDQVIGSENIRMVEIARQHGAAAKFCGSGGAIVGIVEENCSSRELEKAFQREGFVFSKISIFKNL